MMRTPSHFIEWNVAMDATELFPLPRISYVIHMCQEQYGEGGGIWQGVHYVLLRGEGSELGLEFRFKVYGQP
jgi:hypothetical protein